ncbi:MAG: hypothetical protein NTX81_02130 [Candidatus Bathyarchaeota archaeon]|nr:hypothetical protein [Candidatus Bathyarchaeota archaeon]
MRVARLEGVLVRIVRGLVGWRRWASWLIVLRRRLVILRLIVILLGILLRVSICSLLVESLPPGLRPLLVAAVPGLVVLIALGIDRSTLPWEMQTLGIILLRSYFR